jgi:hypothetical protein
MEYGLTYDDLRSVEETIPTAVKVMPMREFIHEARYGEYKLDARVVGATPSYFTVNRLTLARGRFLEATDLEARNNVCVIGEAVAMELFPVNLHLVNRSTLTQNTSSEWLVFFSIELHPQGSVQVWRHKISTMIL